MSRSTLENEWASAYLSGENMAYVDGLYEDYLNNPNAISEEWRTIFDNLPQVNGHAKEVSYRDIRAHFIDLASQRCMVPAVVAGNEKQMNVADLINAYRAHGHHVAQLDPLGMAHELDIPSLNLAFHHL